MSHRENRVPILSSRSTTPPILNSELCALCVRSLCALWQKDLHEKCEISGLAPAGSFGGLTNAAHEFALAPLDVKALGTPALLAQRCFTAGALVWLVYRLGVSALRAGLLAGALLLAVEAVQLWMPGHESTLTAPSLALCAAGLIALFEPEAS